MGMIQLKNRNELLILSEACRISNAALWSIEEYIRPGVTTKELDRVIHKFITSAGAKPSFLGYNGFPASACISVNEEVIHGIPSGSVKLKEGDIVSVDVGAYYKGFHGDNAYTFSVGEVSDVTKRLLTVTEECLQRGISKALVGNRVGDISSAVQAHAESYGFGVVREYVGHGIGHDIHESPEIPNYGKAGRGPRLVPGMVICIEPMINQKGVAIKALSDGWTIVTASGSPSAHFEHTIAITEEGPKILTVR